jgi:hypothetical protein
MRKVHKEVSRLDVCTYHVGAASYVSKPCLAKFVHLPKTQNNISFIHIAVITPMTVIITNDGCGASA